ncbi:hypothetical protein [Halosimplex pelagicum]|uniref:Uncharacterized protein n=1 Tax=Halosimplex pelagicum TaxID=869886 RepID=A0A7D5P8U7_9EURY|nr:hypothetical protein [Halosimplex pelagicum]QLH82141.1 hypothetical protein HZS54_11230 [Halosimplex pelagicum]
MTDQDNPLEHWTTISVDELPEQYPDHVTLDDGPFGWKNIHTDTVLHLEYESGNGEWIVAGCNSVVGRAEDLPSIKAEAREYMRNHRRPSPIVG